MPDTALDILKMVLLILLYLFFARVLWAVWSEVRAPHARADINPMPVHVPVPQHHPDPTPAGAPRPPKGRGANPARLTTLEPKERRGTAYAIGSAFYAYCAPGCAGQDQVKVVQIPTDGTVHNAMIALDANGKPQLLLSSPQQIALRLGFVFQLGKAIFEELDALIAVPVGLSELPAHLGFGFIDAFA